MKIFYKKEYKEEKRINKTLRRTINELEEENRKLKEQNRLLNHDCTVVLENEVKNRGKIKDLENNIEFLVNNLPKSKIKKLGL